MVDELVRVYPCDIGRAFDGPIARSLQMLDEDSVAFSLRLRTTAQEHVKQLHWDFASRRSASSIAFCSFSRSRRSAAISSVSRLVAAV